jgi:hypothetical protein
MLNSGCSLKVGELEYHREETRNTPTSSKIIS